MTKTNTWHNDQERTDKKTFKPKWNKDIILKIIEDLNEMTNVVDIQYGIFKDHSVSLATARLWVEMSRRIMVDMNNGLSFEEATIRDKERRNLMRRKNGLHKGN